MATQNELTSKLQSATTDLEAVKKERDDAISNVSALSEIKALSEKAASERDEALSKVKTLEAELASLKDLEKKAETSVPAAEPVVA